MIAQFSLHISASPHQVLHGGLQREVIKTLSRTFQDFQIDLITAEQEDDDAIPPPYQDEYPRAIAISQAVPGLPAATSAGHA